jgi:HEAT repeat protein
VATGASGKSSRRLRAPGVKYPDVTAGNILARLIDAKALARQQGLEVLIGAPECVAAEVLHELLKSSALDKRALAFEALQQLSHSLEAHGENEPETIRGVWQSLARSPSSDIRGEALHVAARLRAEQSIHILPFWIDDAEAPLRRHALSRLLLTGNPLAAEHALKRIDDEDASVRLAALRILERHAQLDALFPLLKLASGDDKSCRDAALQALLKQAPFFALLAAAELERDAAREAEARAVFVRFKPADITALLWEMLDWARTMKKEFPVAGFAQLLRHVPEDATTKLHANDPPEWIRAAIVEYDGGHEPLPPESLRRLNEACGDSSPAIRAQAVAALARKDAAEPGEFLGRLLRHEQSDVRRMAAEALGRSGPGGLAFLRRALSDSHADVRRSTYDALALLMPDDAADIWTAALRDQDSPLRVYAVERLIALADTAGKSLTPEVQAGLVLAGADRDPAVRIPAVNALILRGVIEKKLAGACRDALAEAIDPAVKSLNTPLVVALIPAVAALMPPGALGTLIGAARHRSAVLRRTAVEALAAKESSVAVEAFALLADTEDPGILKRAATILAKARDPRGLVPVIRSQEECRGQSAAMRPLLDVYPKARELNFLLSALRMQWPSVKRFAAKELLKQESPEVIKPLIEASRDEDVEVQLAAVQALGKFVSRAEVYNRLIEILDYGDVAVRQEAVAVLGQYQVKAAVDALIRLLGNPFLRARVEEALMQIGDRKGFLAIKRRKIREKMFGKKKSKGPLEPPGRKGKVGLGRAKPRK